MTLSFFRKNTHHSDSYYPSLVILEKFILINANLSIFVKSHINKVSFDLIQEWHHSYRRGIRMKEKKSKSSRFVLLSLTLATIGFASLFLIIALVLLIFSMYAFIGTATPFITPHMSAVLLTTSFLSINICTLCILAVSGKRKWAVLAYSALLGMLFMAGFIFLCIFGAVQDDLYSNLSSMWTSYDKKAKKDFQSLFQCCGFDEMDDRPHRPCPTMAENGCWGFMWRKNRGSVLGAVGGLIAIEVLSLVTVLVKYYTRRGSFPFYARMKDRAKAFCIYSK